MPFVDNQGIKTHYEIVGTGPPLLLHHGATHSSLSWHQFGFVDRLKDAYQLILIDARGHGQSDKPHDWEQYSDIHMARDVIALLDHLDIERVNFWGYSMGGEVGYRLGIDYAQRLNTLVIGGAPPYIEPGDEGFKMMIDRFERGAEQGNEAFIAERKARGGNVSPEDETRLRSLDLAAMAAVFRNADVEGCDFRNDLSTITTPTLMYVGEADEPTYSIIIQYRDKLPNARLIVLPELDHMQVNHASELIVPHVKEFLAQFSP